MKRFRIAVIVVTGLAAGLCLLAFPFWILGVPAVKNDYARGWSLGLNVLMVYPATWTLALIPWALFRKKVAENRQRRWDSLVCWGLALLLLAAAGCMTVAFGRMAT